MRNLLKLSVIAAAALAATAAYAAPDEKTVKREPTETPYTNEYQREIRKERQIAREVERDANPRYYRFKRSAGRED